MRLTKRTRTIAVTLFLYSAFIFFPEQWILWAGLQLAMVYWVLDFDLLPSELFSFLFIPPLFAATSFIFIENLQVPWEVVLYAISGVFYYILLLSLNIINVSTIRTVPLRRAAFSALYFLGMVHFFILGIIIIDAGWGNTITILSFWAALVGFAASYLRLFSKSYQWIETLVFAFISAQIVYLVNFWPGKDWITIATVVGLCFIYIGLLQHIIDKSLNNSVIREYLLISIALIGAFLLI